ncbi:Uncharacterized protein DAT39_005713 [Clarias magur]|uniref:Uncharacterized protein n=1 Tax=Clarias magur TaxID=1594786 RepID=A0A8J4X7C8_CLAMG|nr:Uncharacterized protein DAT39_005713 [Clarias magur]
MRARLFHRPSTPQEETGIMDNRAHEGRNFNPVDLLVFGCAADPVMLMCVLCRTSSRYPPSPKAYL